MIELNGSNKKTEFSKKLVTWALVVTSACIAASYILSFLGRDSCTEVTVSIATACIAIAVGYEAKSFGEKNSRNKYGVKIEEQDDYPSDDEPLG